MNQQKINSKKRNRKMGREKIPIATGNIFNFIKPFIKVVYLLILLCGCTITKTSNQNNMVPPKSLPPQSTPKRIQLNEAVRSVFYAPQYVSIVNGYFKDHGLEIELITANGSDKSMTSLISGHSDISLFGSEMAIYVANERKCQTPDCPILFAQLTKRDGSMIVGYDENFSYDSLRGKKIISGRKGGMPQLIFAAVLSKHGIAESELEVMSNIQFELMGPSFKEGQADYVTLFEPTASAVCKATGAHILSSIGKEIDEIPYTCYGATGKYIKENPDVILKFVSSIKKGQEWIFEHSADETASIISPFFPQIEHDILVSSVDNYIKANVWTQNPTINTPSFKLVVELINKFGNGIIDIDPSVVIDNSFCNQVGGGANVNR